MCRECLLSPVVTGATCHEPPTEQARSAWSGHEALRILTRCPPHVLHRPGRRLPLLCHTGYGEQLRIHAGCLPPLCPGRLHARQGSAQRECTARPESVLGAGCLHAAHRLPGRGAYGPRWRKGQPILEPPPARAKPMGARKSPALKSAAPRRRGFARPGATATASCRDFRPGGGPRYGETPGGTHARGAVSHRQRASTHGAPRSARNRGAKRRRAWALAPVDRGRLTPAPDAAAARNRALLLAPTRERSPPPRGAKHGALPFASRLPARIGSPPVRRLPARRHRRQPGSRCAAAARARAEHHLGPGRSPGARWRPHRPRRAPPRSR